MPVLIYTLSLVCIVSITVCKKQKALSKTLHTLSKIHNVIFFSDFKKCLIILPFLYECHLFIQSSLSSVLKGCADTYEGWIFLSLNVAKTCHFPLVIEFIFIDNSQNFHNRKLVCKSVFVQGLNRMEFISWNEK